MIPINELRILNIVGHNGLLFKVADIKSPAPARNKRFNDKGSLSLFDGCSFFSVPDDEAYPIPLSKEGVLEACGFTLHSEYDYINYFNKEKFHIAMWSKDESPGGFEEKGTFYYGDDFIGFKYLHQLQNLHFVATGKELEIDFSKINSPNK